MFSATLSLTGTIPVVAVAVGPAWRRRIGTCERVLLLHGVRLTLPARTIADLRRTEGIEAWTVARDANALGRELAGHGIPVAAAQYVVRPRCSTRRRTWPPNPGLTFVGGPWY